MEALSISSLGEHLTRLTDDFPVVLTRDSDSKTYSGAQTGPDMTQSLVVGGLEQSVDFNFFVVASLFGTDIPVEGESFTESSGRKAKLVSVRKSPDGAQFLNLTFRYDRTSD